MVKIAGSSPVVVASFLRLFLLLFFFVLIITIIIHATSILSLARDRWTLYFSAPLQLVYTSVVRVVSHVPRLGSNYDSHC